MSVLLQQERSDVSDTLTSRGSVSISHVNSTRTYTYFAPLLTSLTNRWPGRFIHFAGQSTGSSTEYFPLIPKLEGVSRVQPLLTSLHGSASLLCFLSGSPTCCPWKTGIRFCWKYGETRDGWSQFSFQISSHVRVKTPSPACISHTPPDEVRAEAPVHKECFPSGLTLTWRLQPWALRNERSRQVLTWNTGVNWYYFRQVRKLGHSSDGRQQTDPYLYLYIYDK